LPQTERAVGRREIPHELNSQVLFETRSGGPSGGALSTGRPRDKTMHHRRQTVGGGGGGGTSCVKGNCIATLTAAAAAATEAIRRCPQHVRWTRPDRLHGARDAAPAAATIYTLARSTSCCWRCAVVEN